MVPAGFGQDPRFPATQVPTRALPGFRLWGFHPLRPAFQTVRLTFTLRFVVGPTTPDGACDAPVWAPARSLRRYLRITVLFSLPRYLDVSVPGFAPGSASAGSAPGGCPIRKSRINGTLPYARLIAACHVLRRLREPRHPSCALLSFPCTLFRRISPSIDTAVARAYLLARHLCGGGEIALFELLLSFSATGLKTGRRFHHVNVLLFGWRITDSNR